MATVITSAVNQSMYESRIPCREPELPGNRSTHMEAVGTDQSTAVGRPLLSIIGIPINGRQHPVLHCLNDGLEATVWTGPAKRNILS